MLVSLVYIFINLLPDVLKHFPFQETIYWMGFFPAMPILIFGCARYHSIFNQFFSKKLFVQLGDASYSIYMMHLFFIMSMAAVPGLITTNENLFILISRGLIACGFILLASLGFYQYFELPIQKWLRVCFKTTHPYFTLRISALFVIFITSIFLIYISSSPIRITDIRITDLDNIHHALQKYRTDNNSYPLARDGLTIANVNSENYEKWIPGLAPTYLKAVPLDPRSDRSINRYYLYISDGIDYKIVAHGADDIATVLQSRPELVDPRRPGHAYGFWTPGAAQW